MTDILSTRIQALTDRLLPLCMEDGNGALTVIGASLRLVDIAAGLVACPSHKLAVAQSLRTIAGSLEEAATTTEPEKGTP